jgi:hypothetical protein
MSSLKVIAVEFFEFQKGCGKVMIPTAAGL